MPVEETNKTEQEYLELAQESKKKFDELECQKDEAVENMKMMQKEILSVYGLIRLIDNMYQDMPCCDPNIGLLLEIVRGYLGQYVENEIM
jgi:hypothetical protein